MTPDSLKPTRQLPPGYRHAYTFALNRTSILIGLNLVGLVLLVVGIAIFTAAWNGLRPAGSPGGVQFEITIWLWITLILVLAGMFVLHELVHGFFFWLFLRTRPKFGFKGAYAYAAAPGWYIPRNRYLVIGLAPLVLISLAVLAVIPFVPATWFLPLIVLFVGNFSGAVGDLWVTTSLLRYPRESLAFDEGDRTELYIPTGEVTPAAEF